MTASDTITYRLATVDDVDALADLRWRMETERHPEVSADRDAYFAAARASIHGEIERGAHIGFLAESGGEVIACAILIWWPMLPTLTELHRTRGYVSSVYTAPAYRRQGIARRLMENLMTRAREMGMSRLILNASTMGRPLYLDLGFTPPSSRSLEWNIG